MITTVARRVVASETRLPQASTSNAPPTIEPPNPERSELAKQFGQYGRVLRHTREWKSGMPQSTAERLTKFANAINPPLRDEIFSAKLEELTHTYRSDVAKAYQELCRRQTEKLESALRRAPVDLREEAIQIAVRRLQKEECPLDNIEQQLRRPLLVAPWLETTRKQTPPSSDDNSWAARCLREELRAANMDTETEDDSLPSPPTL